MDIDTNWINEYENEEKKYSFFYEEPIQSIKYTILYINKDKSIESIIQDKFALKENNNISKDEMIYLIKKYQHNITNEKKYKLISLLLYTFPIQHEEINQFNKNDIDSTNVNPLKSLHYINDVVLEPCILFFHSLNDLFLIFHEKEINNKHNQTKKILYDGKLNVKTKKKSRKQTKKNNQ